MKDIETELNPDNFHHVNRPFILNKESITNIKFYFNGKLIVNISGPCNERVVIGKAKSSEVKNWINS